VNDCSFARLTLVLLLHYLVNCRSRSFAVRNNEFVGCVSILYAPQWRLPVNG